MNEFSQNRTDMEGSKEVLELTCGVQNYDWGKIGQESLVCRLINGGNIVDEDKNQPFAELWMGTHKNSPSKLKSGSNVGYELKEILDENVLSKEVVETYGLDLPFLFKVLSVSKPLSIQTHPDKATAEKINAQTPHIYKDPNHKPEMVISLTEFKALIGFKPFKILRETVLKLRDIQKILGKDGVNKYFSTELNNADDSENTNNVHELEAIEFTVKSILNCDKKLVCEVINSLCNEINSEEHKDMLVSFNIMYEHYPDDHGCLISLLLNYVELRPGDSVFLPANEPHCYIYGDALECMSRSDNVIRIGCTTKYKDLDLFLKTVSYYPKHLQNLFLRPCANPELSDLLHYIPPISEFFLSILKTSITCKIVLPLPTFNGPSIAIVLSHTNFLFCGYKAQFGSVFFVPSKYPITLYSDTKNTDVHISIASTGFQQTSDVPRNA